MDFVQGKFIKRYKRFLVDVLLPEQNQVVTAHCTNSGSLKSCLVPGAPVLLSPVNNPNRKTRYTWEMIKIGDTWVGVNTNKANEIAFEILQKKLIPQFAQITHLQREVKFGKSRIDIMAQTPKQKILIEVKNVTYRQGDYALFPDAVTTRGQKHLQELMAAIEQGYRAAMFFIVQRSDTKIFAPAWEIDPEYSRMLLQARERGVEIYPIQVHITPQGWHMVGIMPYVLENRRITSI